MEGGREGGREKGREEGREGESERGTAANSALTFEPHLRRLDRRVLQETCQTCTRCRAFLRVATAEAHTIFDPGTFFALLQATW